MNPHYNPKFHNQNPHETLNPKVFVQVTPRACRVPASDALHPRSPLVTIIEPLC